MRRHKDLIGLIGGIVYGIFNSDNYECKTRLIFYGVSLCPLLNTINLLNQTISIDKMDKSALNNKNSSSR